MRILLIAAQIAGGCFLALAATDARAESDCDQLQRVMTALRQSQKVETGDIAKAMATERSGLCKAAAASPPAPVAAPTPTPSVQAAAVAAPPSSPSGVFAGFTARAIDPGRMRCARPPQPDQNSADPCDWFALALAYQKGFGVPQDARQALMWLEKSAKAGHAAAQLGLATAHASGYGPLNPNPRAAQHWMVMAAQNFNPVAARMLGSYAEYGTGMPVDYAQAAYWYDQALSRNEIEAAVWLGLLHLQGKGVPQNLARGIDLLKLGAEAGDVNAMFYLGDYYRMGIGVPFDTAQARFWLRKSAALGDEDAPRILAYMDEVDRRYAAMPRSVARNGNVAAGPSFSDQAMEAHRRQGRENCAAAAKGAARPCYIP